MNFFDAKLDRVDGGLPLSPAASPSGPGLQTALYDRYAGKKVIFGIRPRTSMTRASPARDPRGSVTARWT